MDAETFKEIILSRYGDMYRVAYAIVRDSDDAQDVVQDAVIRLWVRRQELSGIESPDAYCMAAVKASLYRTAPEPADVVPLRWMMSTRRVPATAIPLAGGVCRQSQSGRAHDIHVACVAAGGGEAPLACRLLCRRDFDHYRTYACQCEAVAQQGKTTSETICQQPIMRL